MQPHGNFNYRWPRRSACKTQRQLGEASYSVIVGEALIKVVWETSPQVLRGRVASGSVIVGALRVKSILISCGSHLPLDIQGLFL